jgi:hypothetical protein
VQHGHLSVNVGGGNITVRPGQGGAASLTGKVTYSLIRPDVTWTSDGVNVHCRLLVGNCGLDATLTVPPSTGLTLSSGGGDQTVSGISGGVTLSSDGGNVSLQSVGGTVSVSTGGGDLNASDLAGPLTFTTDGGDVNGTAIGASHVTVQAQGGDVTLTFTGPPANVEVHSDGGNIHLVLPHNAPGYDVSTNADGGNSSIPVRINTSSPDKIIAASGGGDISVTYAS